MSDKIFSQSQLPIRRTVDLLPEVFKTEANSKFMSGVVDPLIQPGVLEKTVGYIGRRYGKTYKDSDVYLDTDETLRSVYQLEPGVVISKDEKTASFHDYIDFKNQLKFYGNSLERDDLFTEQDHYSWTPPIEWDKFVNYREYYWVPMGPPTVKILGQNINIISTYKVRLGDNSSWTLMPDGLTPNPTITLYRGQTYIFDINAPRNNFYIRTSNTAGSSSNYSKGVTNNGTVNGKLKFVVPFDAPDILFYQSEQEPDRVGTLLISDIESNSKIDVDKEILGKTTYKSSNGVEFTNGLIIEFGGQTIPHKYEAGRWLVEGVGTGIRLIDFNTLVPPSINSDVPEVFFDNAGFDTEPYDDARSYPLRKDYITINRASIDFNPWSRYNRWFHRSVLEYAHSVNGTVLDLTEDSRAKRPIIEFVANLQLFQHGAVAKTNVDYIDTFTKDVFSTVEGSTGYNIDGEFLFEGARVLFTADTDSWVNNKIYKVTFITHNNRKQISLIEESDSTSILGECLLVKRGNVNAGKMFYFDGSKWNLSQEKTSVNQFPKFDAFDENGISYSDTEVYPVSNFVGTEILSYKIGNTGIVDTELGFKLSYLNIDNVGDIQFEFDWDIQTFTWQKDQLIESQPINKGYFKINEENFNSRFENSWLETDKTYLQPIVESKTTTSETDTLSFTACNWVEGSRELISFYLNGILLRESFSRVSLDTFKFSRTFSIGDVVTIKIYTDQTPNLGYYEIPLSLERNPLNQNISYFTLGQATDHLGTMAEVSNDFTGTFPGASNLRDIAGYQNKGRRFLKHSGSAALPITMLANKDLGIVNAIEYSKRSYTEFKNTFISLITEYYYDQRPIDFVDELMNKITATKSKTDPFSDSDMIGCGAYTKLEYLVEDEGIVTFALSKKFDLNTLSREAVYVYLNSSQLIVGKDYKFDSNFGFVTILAPLAEGDTIEIREYLSTAFNFIPATPTSLGMYKKYTPSIYVDDTYQTPTNVIQGHDGSLTVAFNDVRDEIILELEKRIYNNIKKEYNSDIFDIDTTLGGYYSSPIYKKNELDSVIAREFLQWASNSDVDYVSNNFFNQENSFTYTYSKMTDPTGRQSLPGFWRGVYLWFYDTDRPHQRPWEMLGFSEEPTWWVDEYGPAPYTSGNLILWEDLERGIIKQGSRAGEYDRYKRPGLVNYIPVDGDGNLLSPLESGLATNFSLINNQGDFVFGDSAPVEYAWRRSSEWPFAIMVALTLLRPFDFINKFLDSNQLYKNKLGQFVNKSTNNFTTIADIQIPVVGEIQTTGVINWVMDYLRSKARPASSLKDILSGIDVKLSNRIGGFVDQSQQRYLLDSKNPKSSSSSLFIPLENYDIVFNVSSPVSSIAYSGVIIEKTNKGWKILGYDNLSPTFNYYEAVPSQSDFVISVGGVSEGFANWVSGKYYNNGQIVRYNNAFFRTVTSHTSGDTFDQTLFKQIPKLPQVGAVEVLKRKTFNKLRIKQLGYGTVLSSIQEVVDFLLGYEQYLISLGLKFDQFDKETQVNRDWLTSCKEFMFWTKHNWAEGSLLTLSPAADKVEIDVPFGVADNLLDTYYDYQIFKSDGTPLLPNFINVNRDIQKLTVTTTNTTDGIYFIKINFVLKEHVVLFEDRTVFNDVIYDKPTGYRQDRIKVRGFRTTDWDGDYTSPGFLFDNVDIKVWQSFTDYRLGDIVAYREFFWTSLENQSGTESFDETKWTKLDSSPTKSLVPNFDYKINQFDDFYDLDSDGVGSSQRSLARHGIGYQERKYLEDLAEDQVSQFKIYQGFIREKGTFNSIKKVFDKLSNASSDSVTLKEEWAFRVGQFGGTEQVIEYEFSINKPDLKINPQPILFVNSVSNETDSYIRLAKNSYTIPPLPYTTAINPVINYELTRRCAGYVKNDQVKFAVKSRDNILTLDILAFENNDHVWVTFDNDSWTVLRYDVSDLRVSPIFDESTTASESLPFIRRENNTLITVGVNKTHNIKAGDIVGIRGVVNLEGFFKVDSVEYNTITLQVSEDLEDPILLDNQQGYIGVFVTARFSDYNTLGVESVALLRNGARLWVDQNGDNKWEVIEKTNQYTSLEVTDLGIPEALSAGQTVLYVDSLKQVIASIPSSNYVVSYNAARPNLAASQFIRLAEPFSNYTNNSFGSSIAVSQDNKWLIVGSPKASGVPSNYRGDYNTASDYVKGDIVSYNGSLWTAVVDIIDDGSTNSIIDLNSDKWEPSTLNPALTQGSNSGYFEQGMISIYEWGNIETVPVTFDIAVAYPKGSIVTYQGRQYISVVDTEAGTLPLDSTAWQLSSGRWNEVISIVSPYPSANENFGSSIAVAKYNNEYVLAVAATGGSTGTVYLYKYQNGNWIYLKENGYAGPFDSSKLYPAGSIVWYDNQLYQASIETEEEFPGETENWVLLNDISVQNSLPGKLLSDDLGDSTVGIVGDDLSEMLKVGDKFGYSMAFTGSGDTLIVSAPYSDGQYYANFKGAWEDYQVYTQDDVVRYDYIVDYDQYGDPIYDRRYYKFVSPEDFAGAVPVGSVAWQALDEVSNIVKGKVFVYRRNAFSKYKLVQTITADSISELDIAAGDLFGYSIDIDRLGNTLVISAPFGDINSQDQGSVYVFSKNLVTGEYKFTQKLESYELINNENFGNSVSVSENGTRIVVGAQNSIFTKYTSFEQGVSFDSNKTRFVDSRGFSGNVYVFEKKDTRYILGEKLDVNVEANESFGASVDCTETSIVVGSPNYRNSDGDQTGKIRYFSRSSTVNSWKILSQQTDLVNIDLLSSLSVYDPIDNKKLADVDIIDPIKTKILGLAEQELKFKTPYDPAIYMIGSANQVVDADQAWFEKNVGSLWWDVSTAKWIWYEQGDVAYRTGNWAQQAVGSSIDVYEWVESILLPSEWASIADTAEGLAEGVSGQPLHPDDSVYSYKEKINSTTGQVYETKYYYWVKNKNTLPGIPQRRLTAAEVAALINNPIGSGQPIVALIDSDKLLTFNFGALIPNDVALVNIQYVKTNRNLNLIHSEYQLISEGDPEGIPSSQLETKWIDSLIGFDKAGNQVPDPNLSAKQKYGIGFRPRQSMFINRNKALEIVIDRINSILLTRPFTELLNFSNLNKVNPIPDLALNLYDQEVDTLIDLETVGTARLSQAIVRANIIDGQIDTIDVVEPGFGYRVAPPIDIQGTGTGAKAQAVIDNQGRIVRVDVIQKGKKYNNVILRVRPFSVLVKSDSSSNNFWTIYAWDQKSKAFYRSKTQEFNTPNYWYYTDWWLDGYSSNSRVVTEIFNLYFETGLTLETGDLLRVKEYGNGGWAVLERVESNGEVLGKYRLVGRELGTLQFKSELYNSSINNVGYDNLGSYDSIPYDQQPINELRNIFDAIKNDILINDLRVEYNKLFFSSIGYIFSEQLYVDWAFKTSFMSAIHKVGDLNQRPTYKSDNLESFKAYIEEVKPYRTKIREYTSQYTEYQSTDTDVTDFDNPPIYSEAEKKIVTVGLNSEDINLYPRKYWADNRGYSVVNIILADQGTEYTTPPRVIISSDTGTGASAQAYISNGRVSGITLISQGTGYLTAPTVSLVGGNGVGKPARAIAVLGEGKVRNFNLAMKFDRVSKEGIYTNLQQDEEFIASGTTSVFELTYAPTRDKSKISVSINGEVILNNEYRIDLYISEIDTYSLLKGKITFNSAPVKGSTIKISYDKNDLLLDATNRIEKLYSPKDGMLGYSAEKVTLPIKADAVDTQLIELETAKDIKEGMRVRGTGVVPCRVLKVASSTHIVLSEAQTLSAGNLLEFSYSKPNQLMTGIDFGGVQIQGNPFDVTGGWDALPWFTDGWDSVESSTDYYFIAGPNVEYVSLPYTPADGELITVYLQKSGETTNTRVDDPYYDLYDGSTVQPNGRIEPTPEVFMNTFVGTGDTRIIDIPKKVVPTIVSEHLYIHNTTVNSNNPSGDVDYVTFTVGTLPITALYLTKYVGVDQIAFFAIQQGTAWTAGYDVNQMLVYSHFGPSVDNYGLGDNILATADVVLEANTTYTMWIQQTGTNLTEYAFSTNPSYTGETVLPADYSQNPLNPTQLTLEVVTGTVLENYVNEGDTLIFRSATSDGTVIINDPNLIDTEITGGTLETIRGLYSTATGKTAEEIIIEGEKFISPDQVPSPEENVPGQVLDSVSIKVFHSKQAGAPTMMAKVEPVRNGQVVFDVGQEVVEFGNVFVYVDKVKKLYGIDYNINFDTNQVIFNNAITEGSLVEIVSVGLGGQSIIGYEEFVADGDTRLFLTNSNYNDTAQVLVTVNGNYIDSGFSNSNGRVNDTDKTLIELGQAPESGSVVKIIVLGSSLTTDTNQEPVIRVNQQSIIIDGSTRTYDLDNFVDLERSSARGSMLVELNNRYLKSSDTTYIVFDGSNSEIKLGLDPLVQPGSIAINDLKVYRNSELTEFLTDWTFDGPSNTIFLIDGSFNIGDAIRIEQNINADYSVVNGQLVIDNSVSIQDQDKIVVTWFNEYPSVDLLKEVYSGGKSQYTLARKPLGISYIWVYLNGERLTSDVDYTLSVVKNVIVLLKPSQLTDIVEIVQFGNDVYTGTVGFEIFEDMLNTTHYKRYSISNVALAKDLNYFDTSIELNDANVAEPSLERKTPGIIEINGERIEYFKKTGNVLSQLRRGTLGTAIAEIHLAGSKVVDLSSNETIPYTEPQEKISFKSDGSTVEFGPYDFISSKPTSTSEFYRITIPVKDSQGRVIDTLYPSIPADNVACDEVEIFVGGRRLNKTSVKVYEENLGASSPTADINKEAEFSVNRTTKTIRLTSPVPAGVQITIIRKSGKVWYENGENSASNGVTLLDNNTNIVKFIEKKSTLLP